MRPHKQSAPAFCLVATALALGASCADGSSSPVDLIQPNDDDGRVDTLVMLLGARLDSADPKWAEHSGLFLDHGQIRSIRIDLNGRPWGIFENEPQAPNAPEVEVEVDGWALTSSASQALFVADLGNQADVDADKMKTVGDWVVLLRRYLAPGGYVAELAEITFENTTGQKVSIQPRALLPFTIHQGDETAFVGETTLVVDGL